MEIRCLAQEENGRTRSLYEEVFVEDEKAFVDAYYQIKAKDNVILVAEDGQEIVAMLHRNPYTFRLRGKIVPADYIVAVATKFTYRHQGWMRRLLTKALLDMEAQKLPFTFLMPADEEIYRPFDFRLMGNWDEAEMAQWKPEQLAEEYDLFVEKDADYERRHINWPEWETTPMMVRLVHLPAFVEHIGAQEEQRLILAIEDPILPENNGTFCWTFDEKGSRLESLASEAAEKEESGQEEELRISIADLGSFLFGMLGAEELTGISAAGKKSNVLAKLERIKTLNGIYVNEIV